MNKINDPRLEINLPKWPALIVSGKKVTPDQAKEIILRTTSYRFFSNDKQFLNQLCEVLGVKLEEYGYINDNDLDRIEKEINIVPNLEYMENHQIVSCWIGGPHGWCDWNGNIFTNNYNIGKWPSAEDIYSELSKIAKAFPFLEMTCQLCNGETCENPIPLIQFEVKNGAVEIVDISLQIPIQDAPFKIFSERSERGCSIQQFKEAYEYVKNLVGQNDSEQK